MSVNEAVMAKRGCLDWRAGERSIASSGRGRRVARSGGSLVVVHSRNASSPGTDAAEKWTPAIHTLPASSNGIHSTTLSHLLVRNDVRIVPNAIAIVVTRADAGAARPWWPRRACTAALWERVGAPRLLGAYTVSTLTASMHSLDALSTAFTCDVGSLSLSRSVLAARLARSTLN